MSIYVNICQVWAGSEPSLTNLRSDRRAALIVLLSHLMAYLPFKGLTAVREFTRRLEATAGEAEEVLLVPHPSCALDEFYVARDPLVPRRVPRGARMAISFRKSEALGSFRLGPGGHIYIWPRETVPFNFNKTSGKGDKR